MHHHEERLFCKNSTLQLADTEILIDLHSRWQHIQVIRHREWGHVLLLDGVIQLCDRYEWSYHEMMVHVALRSHPCPKRALILGGGDGGCARELARYEHLEEIIVCDIDPEVTHIAREYFGQVACGLDDPRVRLVHEDGAKLVQEYRGEAFDIIIIDSTDDTEDETLGGILHGREILSRLSNIAAKDALIVSYGDSPFSRVEFYAQQYRSLCSCFVQVTPYLAFVPMYQSGCFGFFMSSLEVFDPHRIYPHSGDFESLQYYHQGIHSACQILPQYVERLLDC